MKKDPEGDFGVFSFGPLIHELRFRRIAYQGVAMHHAGRLNFGHTRHVLLPIETFMHTALNPHRGVSAILATVSALAISMAAAAQHRLITQGNDRLAI
ncbi:MAG TPA: hypothetical protein DCG14_04040, partial [Phycisphaerales bacterium]|nr:hypothetical protein [Phycisphaerales bacterium]